MICSACLDSKLYDVEVDYNAIPAAATVIHGRALCLTCYWNYVTKNRPQPGEMPTGRMEP